MFLGQKAERASEEALTPAPSDCRAGSCFTAVPTAAKQVLSRTFLSLWSGSIPAAAEVLTAPAAALAAEEGKVTGVASP